MKRLKSNIRLVMAIFLVIATMTSPIMSSIYPYFTMTKSGKSCCCEKKCCCARSGTSECSVTADLKNKCNCQITQDYPQPNQPAVVYSNNVENVSFLPVSKPGIMGILDNNPDFVRDSNTVGDLGHPSFLYLTHCSFLI